MKRYVKSAEFTSKPLEHYNYTVVDAVTQEVIDIIKSIGSFTDSTADKIKLHLTTSYSNYDECYSLRCQLANKSVLDVDGTKVIVMDVGKGWYRLKKPLQIDSPYGTLITSDDEEDLYAYMAVTLLDISIPYSATSLDDKIYYDDDIKDKAIYMSDLATIVPDSITSHLSSIKQHLNKRIQEMKNVMIRRAEDQHKKAQRATTASVAWIPEAVTNYIQERVAEVEPEGLGFIDGDTFAFAQDEAVHTGSIKKCISNAKKLAKEDLGEYTQDNVDELVFNLDALKTLYNMSDIVRLFKNHGKFDSMPDWYFNGV